MANDNSHPRTGLETILVLHKPLGCAVPLWGGLRAGLWLMCLERHYKLAKRKYDSPFFLSAGQCPPDQGDGGNLPAVLLNLYPSSPPIQARLLRPHAPSG
jgi:hypothetical protein